MTRLRLNATCIAALCLIGWSTAARGQDDGAVVTVHPRSGGIAPIVISLHDIASIRFNPCDDIVIRLNNGKEIHADHATYGTLKFTPCGGADGARGVPFASTPYIPGERSAGLSLSLFPNPTSSSLSIEIMSDRRDEGKVTIYDLAGNRVWVREGIEIPAGATRIIWGGTTSEGIAVPSGTYIVQVAASGREVVQYVNVTK